MSCSKSNKDPEAEAAEVLSETSEGDAPRRVAMKPLHCELRRWRAASGHEAGRAPPVMAAGARPAAPALFPQRHARLSRPPLLLLLPVLLLAMAAGASSSSSLCMSRVEACMNPYHEEETRLAAASPCAALLRSNDCVRQTASRICRGDLMYHSTITILRGKIVANNCNASVGAQPSRPTLPPAPPAPTPAPSQKCRFQGRQEFRHCLLFGDPHLKTFFSEFQTCRVKGAWPLIDNDFLGVQVTNEQVRPHSPATATTKVTIVIRGREHPCAQEKTYQATSDTPALPTTFVDGTQRSSGPEEAISLRVLSPEHVEIHVRYLDAVLVVRQSGRWLAFSARLPVELLVGPGQSDLQLCVRGCPANEQLAPAARGAALSHEAAWARCRDAAPAYAPPPPPPPPPPASANDSDPALALAPASASAPAPLTLTDEYLDWCIFDVMTTGDEEADYFTAAAYHAQEDVLRLDPASLRNRTTARMPDPAPGSIAAAGSGAGGDARMTMLAALLAAVLAGATAHARG